MNNVTDARPVGDTMAEDLSAETAAEHGAVPSSTVPNKDTAFYEKIGAYNCAICLGSIWTKKSGLCDPCGHIFHQSCFCEWAVTRTSISSFIVNQQAALQQTKCPVCNTGVRNQLNMFFTSAKDVHDDFKTRHQAAEEEEKEEAHSYFSYLDKRIQEETADMNNRVSNLEELVTSNNQQIEIVKHECANLREQVEQAKLQAEETQLVVIRINAAVDQTVQLRMELQEQLRTEKNRNATLAAQVEQGRREIRLMKATAEKEKQLRLKLQKQFQHVNTRKVRTSPRNKGDTPQLLTNKCPNSLDPTPRRVRKPKIAKQSDTIVNKMEARDEVNQSEPSVKRKRGKGKKQVNRLPQEGITIAQPKLSLDLCKKESKMKEKLDEKKKSNKTRAVGAAEKKRKASSEEKDGILKKRIASRKKQAGESNVCTSQPKEGK